MRFLALLAASACAYPLALAQPPLEPMALPDHIHVAPAPFAPADFDSDFDRGTLLVPHGDLIFEIPLSHQLSGKRLDSPNLATSRERSRRIHFRQLPIDDQLALDPQWREMVRIGAVRVFERDNDGNEKPIDFLRVSPNPASNYNSFALVRVDGVPFYEEGNPFEMTLHCGCALATPIEEPKLEMLEFILFCDGCGHASLESVLEIPDFSPQRFADYSIGFLLTDPKR